ncbi:MAG: putative membrane protein [Cryomorphaceae bacterium]|jgi:putative membrane protein
MTGEAVEKKFKPWIIVLSVVVPVLVAILFTVKIDGFDTSFLPPIYASLNALTAVFLIAGVISIKNKKIETHRKFMTSAIVFSALFLVLYVVYHSTSDSTPYGGEGWIRPVYFTLLISHILLSIIIIPLVLVTYVRALAKRFDKHRKIARITFPIWLYVAITGVVVYLMISPYYV